ncbi:DUF4328 domain-containing protein [Streptomyces venezuelae]|uniref:DUF4328 domain-containing protein n=1 Tax=Streptomyces venezuelae TaxID=54571 RepID=UPI00278C216A|nr:DUF4328 domain-containing protein [Streptomyces venezuelae]
MDAYNVPVGPAAVRGPRYRFRNPAGPAVVVQSLIATQALTDVYVIATGGAHSPWLAEDMVPWPAVLQVACWIAFLFWFHRVRCNAEVLAPGSHKYSPAFALGAWIIPLAMWWLPRRITLDIQRLGGTPRDVWLINAWWLVWLLDGPLSVAFHYLVLGHWDYHNPVDESIDVLCAVLAIALVRRVTAGQPAGPLPYFNMT